MSANQLKLLVRADVGAAVGTGHVMRMLALGQAWKQAGGEVKFVCGKMPVGLIKRIESAQVQIHQIRNDRCDGADAGETIEIASAMEPDWIVLDGYQFDDTYQHVVKNSGARLMVVDDYQHASHKHADLVINQNCYAKSDQYSNSGPTRYLVGERYALLRNEFAAPFESWQTTRASANQVRRILVTFGGADPDNWTLRTLQALSDLKRKRLSVECVIGACYEHAAELEMFKKTTALSLKIHRNVDRMSGLMAHADLAITAGGSTCYELARCGTPAIVVSIAENQKRVAEAMHQNQVMISIDHLPADSVETGASRESRLIFAIRRLLDEPELRREMSLRGAQMINGNGAARTVQQMVASLYHFRPATMADSELMWQWRNDAEVRSVSFNKKLIPFEKHQNWLQNRLGDPDAATWISEDIHGTPVAQIRFDFNDHDQTALISIIVNQAKRGRGLGKLLIASACQQMFENSPAVRIVAQIKPSNTASGKAFRRRRLSTHGANDRTRKNGASICDDAGWQRPGTGIGEAKNGLAMRAKQSRLSL